MLIQASSVPVSLDALLPDAQECLMAEVARALGIKRKQMTAVTITRKSVDARKRNHVHFVLSVLVDIREGVSVSPNGTIVGLRPIRGVRIQQATEADNPLRDNAVGVVGKPSQHSKSESKDPMTSSPGNFSRPIVVGSGPAGLFCTLRLARAGLSPLLIEQGRPVDERKADVEAFFAGGALNPVSNIQFGEGGAGTFSDGKLTTGTKSIYIRAVLTEFVRCGAPADILVDAKPHIGTDILITVVRELRNAICDAHGEILFSTQLVGIEQTDGCVSAARLRNLAQGVECTVPTHELVLAIGHSARETFALLQQLNIPLERKPFAVGVRIEHPQKMINEAQYGVQAFHPALGAADYKLAVHNADGRGVYTFCMCPGGSVVAAASEEGGVCVNGMSAHARNGCNANAALLVEVRPDDLPGDDPLAGVELQRTLERAAFKQGGGAYAAPVQTVGSFLGQPCDSFVTPTYPRSTTPADLHQCLPSFVTEALEEALPALGRKLNGFDDPRALMTAVEARSSSPVRILRDATTLDSLGMCGLYPAGEGAGYAGGIMSAACDGLKVADAIIEARGTA